MREQGHCSQPDSQQHPISPANAGSSARVPLSIDLREADTVAVVIDTDQWVGSTDGWRLDFTEAIGFPYNNDLPHTTSGVMINTTREDHQEKGFEAAAVRAGFKVLHRSQKLGESCSRTRFTRGSLALLGAVMYALASKVDILVIHAWNTEAALLVQQVLLDHKEVKVVIVASHPSHEMRGIPNEYKGRCVIVDPRPFREHLEEIKTESSEEDNREEPVWEVIPVERLFESNRPNGSGCIGKALDVANITRWGNSLGSRHDSIFDAEKLGKLFGSGPKISVMVDKNDRTEQREGSRRYYQEAGWTILDGAVGEDGGLLDDGLIGLAMARLAACCSQVWLFSGDSDFMPVEKLLSDLYGTEMHRVALPVLDVDNQTKRGVFESWCAEFHSIMDVIAEADGSIVNVTESLYPPNLTKSSKPQNQDAKRDWRADRNKFRQDMIEGWDRTLTRKGAGAQV